MKFAAALWAIGLSLQHAAGDSKTWAAGTLLGGAGGWGAPPCPDERLLLPAVAAFLPPAPFAVAEMVLSENGQLLFPEKAALVLTGGQSDASCPQRDVLLAAPTSYWSDPGNWNVTSPRLASPSGRALAVPDAFRVPCRSDDARFDAPAFSCRLDLQGAAVAQLAIHGQGYSDAEVRGLLDSAAGRLLFPGGGALGVTGRPCDAPSGCSCGNDHPSVLPTICRHRLPCPPVECSDPVQPVGHCCPVCGAWILVEYEGHFKMDVLVELHKTFLDKAQYRDVESFACKTYQDEIESVFLDGPGRRAVAGEAARAVHDALLAGASRYGVRSARLRRSVRWEASDRMTASEGMSAGGASAVALAVVGALLLLALYVYRRRQASAASGFSFARFDLGAAKIELELDTTPHDQLDPATPPGGAFENPTYGATATVVEEVDEPAEGENYVENPMFMIFESAEENKSDDSRTILQD